MSTVNIGSAQDAIDFAIRENSEAVEFLRAWQEGHLNEWPEYFIFLEGRDRKAQERSASALI